jgi:hypothetical protein
MFSLISSKSILSVKAATALHPRQQSLSRMLMLSTTSDCYFPPDPVANSNPFTYDLTNLNPPPILKVIQHPYDVTKHFTVINDGLTCIGGSKQRLLDKLLPYYPEQEEIVLSGTSLGLAQIALAITCKKYGKQASIFLEGSLQKETSLTKVARDLGANIYYSPINLQHTTLSEAYFLAEQHVSLQPTKRLLMPIGLKSPPNSLIFQCFRSALQVALFQNDSISTSLSLPALDHRYPPKRLWIVSGTGFLANVLHSLWPTTEFLIIPADISVWSKTDVIDKKHQIFYPNQPFPDEASLQPPYPTIPWYDAKLWQFVLQHGQDGDYIWNVGRLL